ncbi:hypothetical protein B296_00030767 [Ensete ventricosum]|uniref:Uncharacterized protein n=1 Tax=Ensete ventricosum TaxID=4639 RepID=A0A427AC95_ENSVE|nr:hypothetical protein B296_00030767 [Ensete ventricosum]
MARRVRRNVSAAAWPTSRPKERPREVWEERDRSEGSLTVLRLRLLPPPPAADAEGRRKGLASSAAGDDAEDEVEEGEAFSSSSDCGDGVWGWNSSDIAGSDDREGEKGHGRQMCQLTWAVGARNGMLVGRDASESPCQCDTWFIVHTPVVRYSRHRLASTVRFVEDGSIIS